MQRRGHGSGRLWTARRSQHSLADSTEVSAAEYGAAARQTLHPEGSRCPGAAGAPLRGARAKGPAGRSGRSGQQPVPHWARRKAPVYLSNSIPECLLSRPLIDDLQLTDFLKGREAAGDVNTRLTRNVSDAERASPLKEPGAGRPGSWGELRVAGSKAPDRSSGCAKRHEDAQSPRGR